jgi:AbrB family looped-hinge helix DNA binding protein
MSSIATLSSKSQITIPAWARRQLALEPGAKVRLRVDGDRIIVEPIQRSIEELEGALRGIYGAPDRYVDEQREDRRP